MLLFDHTSAGVAAAAALLSFVGTQVAGIDPGVVASVGGTTLASIIAGVAVKGYAEYARLSRKRELAIDAQLAEYKVREGLLALAATDLRERADHRRRRSVHRKSERAHWHLSTRIAHAAAGVPGTVYDSPTSPIDTRPRPPADSHTSGSV